MKKCNLIVFALVIVFFACVDETPVATGVKKELITGFVQKGPFINGSSITIAELDNSLNQTGRVYYSSIFDNSGKFEQQNIELISKYALLKADGFYFNENTGTNSNSQFTLFALADLSDKNSVNVNILTNLERSRTEYLLKKGSHSFTEAKKEAQKEILDIFSITKPEMANSEDLDLVIAGEDNAILLAISIIIQGFRNTADMSELIANIVSDFREDGVLTDQTLGCLLINDARLLDLAKIRTNIEKKYQNIGLSVVVPDFEKYVNMFIENTPYVSTKKIIYPKTSNYGINLLNDSLISIDRTINDNFGYTMAASLPVGTSLKIVLSGGIWYYMESPRSPINWNISIYNNEMQTFTVTESGKDCDVQIQLWGSDTISVEYYENNAVTATKIKKLVLN